MTVPEVHARGESGPTSLVGATPGDRPGRVLQYIEELTVESGDMESGDELWSGVDMYFGVN